MEPQPLTGTWGGKRHLLGVAVRAGVGCHQPAKRHLSPGPAAREGLGKDARGGMRHSGTWAQGEGVSARRGAQGGTATPMGKAYRPHPGLSSPWPEGRHPLGLHSELSGTETYLPLAQRTRLMHLIQTLEREGLSFLVSFSLENSEQSHLGFFSAFIPLPPPPPLRGLLYPTLFIFLAETRKYSTMPHLPSVLDTPCFKQISTYKGEGWETWGPPTAALRIGCKRGQLGPPLGEAVSWLPGRRHSSLVTPPTLCALTKEGQENATELASGCYSREHVKTHHLFS